MRDLPGLLCGIFEESADARQLTRRGGRAKALPPALSEESPQVRSGQAVQIGGINRPTPMPLEEVDQSVRSRDIGPHCVRRAAAVVLEMGSPARGQRAGCGV